MAKLITKAMLEAELEAAKAELARIAEEKAEAAKGAQPLTMTRGKALWAGATVGGLFSALSCYTVHFQLPYATGGKWWGLLLAVIGGLLLSAPTCYRTLTRFFGNDTEGKAKAMGGTILAETLMVLLAGWAVLVPTALVLALNAASGAQNGADRLTK